ncbi:hypothetical protein GCM10027030_28810 [Luteococcus sediminum]
MDTELGARADHLRQAQDWPLHRVQGHDAGTDHLADEHADDGPQRICSEHDGQGAIDDGGDLQVGAEPQRELAERLPVTL